MNRIFKAVVGIFLCGLILTGGKVSAAEVDAMEIFRETVYETARIDDRIFHQDIFFVVPSAVGELEFIAGTEGSKIRVAGNAGFWMTSDNGELTEVEVPFYIAQTDSEMTIYFQTDKKWKKKTAPLAAGQITDTFLTPNLQQIQSQIDIAKEVTILQESDSQRTFLVKLDGNKIADQIRSSIRAQAEVDGMKNNQFANYIDTGIRSADIWYTWTVNKNTWQTVTLSANLSGIVQSIAMTALNDSENPLPEPFRNMLETVAFYSELRAYTTYLNPEAKSRLEIPKKVLKAKEVESFTDDKKKK